MQKDQKVLVHFYERDSGYHLYLSGTDTAKSPVELRAENGKPFSTLQLSELKHYIQHNKKWSAALSSAYACLSA